MITVTDGQILSANPAACAMFQMTEAEICAAGRLGLIDMTDPRVFEGIKERQRTGKAKVEITCIRKDGSRFPGELTSSVYINALGEKKTSMILRDITDRKNAEAAIIESEAFNRGVINSLSSHIAVINSAGTIIKVNRPWTDFALNNGGANNPVYCEGANYFDVINNRNDVSKSDGHHEIQVYKMC